MPCRWKKRSASIPSGMRMTEHGLPARCSIIHGPTSSRYRARSSLVTAGRPCLAGHRAFSALEMETPITDALVRLGSDIKQYVALLGGPSFSSVLLPLGMPRCYPSPHRAQSLPRRLPSRHRGRDSCRCVRATGLGHDRRRLELGACSPARGRLAACSSPGPS